VTSPAAIYETRHRRWILGLAIAISLAFLFIIRSFFLTVLLAAIAAALATPLYDRLRASAALRRLRRPQTAAAALTLVLVLVVILVPLIGLLGIVADRQQSQSAIPWIRSRQRPDAFDELASSACRCSTRFGRIRRVCWRRRASWRAPWAGSSRASSPT
jgi:predicted PurR-regulated permease PerM